MSVQILGSDGISLLDVKSAGNIKAVPVIVYSLNGLEVNVNSISEYYVSINIPTFITNLPAGSVLFALRNGSVRKVKLLMSEVNVSFSGTDNSSVAQYSFRRFTNATPSGGTILTNEIVKEDSNMIISEVVDIRCATESTALTTTGVIIGSQIYPAICSRSHISQTNTFSINRDIVLNANEGILFQYDTSGQNKDAVSVTLYWAEHPL